MRALAIVLLISACAHRPERVVTVPKTPEAMTCWRECKAIEATCALRPVTDRIDGSEEQRRRCGLELQDCIMTCPGAREEWR